MLELSIVNQQIAIAGKVLQGETEKPISGAIVELVEMPEKFRANLALKALQYGSQWQKLLERPDRKVTTNAGYFYFTNLPSGEYILEASLPTNPTLYNEVRTKVKISPPIDGKVTTTIQDVVLLPTGIKGTITDANEPKKLVANAKVQIQNSGDSTISDQKGNYQLIGLESPKSGQRTINLIVSATGYQQLFQTIDIQRGEIITEKNFALKPK
ncbi:carboxypeptidase regulatory-like domain-containing protein [Nostoc sp. FACHB-152]|uniref:carboxypeptidase regulatory-like domain-containing protein n=1 Tax=unclassified Nostoc TaxID=2593658 RepID=UPI001687D7F0|nr:MULTISPECIES: carboxypeptidase regulatory-like domain-containing protein [unclassified Nostoc]MBD2449061.1 carboxypeptidase regulatory-like domain-containing protein [Nostoc sp. FACHB-152]MBD2471035.1 carboxypeptidase regulatory-like domain-containing protein [Nostoc sp. FACHB-145]